MKTIREGVQKLKDTELRLANEANPLFRSKHEGYAVILEEYDELEDDMNEIAILMGALWNHITSDEPAPDIARELRKWAIEAACEAIQVAAMAEKYIKSQDYIQCLRQFAKISKKIEVKIDIKKKED